MESVIVYTGRDLRQMRAEGGCGHWTASPNRVEAGQYLVCVRNSREQLAARDFEHGTAFLIAKITGAKPSPHAARIIVEFKSLAPIAVPGAWQLLTRGQRFPVAYLETAELFRRLQLDPGDLAWQSLSGDPPSALLSPTAPDMVDSPATVTSNPRAGFTELILDAKRGLADSLGIPTESVEITVRM